MPNSKLTRRHNKIGVSWPQLFVLHVAAIYKLHRSTMGWWAYRPDADLNWVVHSPATVKSLFKKGLLEGNAQGENVAVEGWYGETSEKASRPELWASAAGKALLDKITSETGIVFDRKNYRLVEPKPRDDIAVPRKLHS